MITPTLCGICPGGCAVDAMLDGDGRLLELKIAKDTPYAAICPRATAAAEIVYSPDRLQTPLIRCGERGEGRFRPASWDEALDLIAARMQSIKQTHGAPAMVSHYGRGAFEQSALEFDGRLPLSARFMWAFGSPNNCSVGSLCYNTYGLFAPISTLGLPASRLTTDIDHSQLVVVWGANPVTDSPPFFYQALKDAQRRGVRLIAIDHMRSDVARRADHWLQVRPGSDGALALGLLHVVITEQLYDQDFVEQWTHGFAELRDYVQAFPPAEVEAITGVPREQIVALAREIATTRQVSLKTYTGLEYSNSGTQSLRAVFILWAITGHLDEAGGLYIEQPTEPLCAEQPPQPPVGVKPIGADKYPLFYALTRSAQFMEFPQAVLTQQPYPVKGLLLHGCSVLTSYPQPARYRQAFEQLDLLVVIDRFMTADAAYADVVLPSATHFETDSYQTYPGYARLRRRLIAPVGQSRHDVTIFGELAARLGLAGNFPRSESALIARAFSARPDLLAAMQASADGVPLPVAPRRYRKYQHGLLREDGQPGFPTPSGKLEIASTLLAEYGHAPLPEYLEPLEGPRAAPQLAEQYPLVLNTGARIRSTFRSQHLNIPKLLRLQPKPQVLIHPQDAAARGIADGDAVTVSTSRGSVPFYACVTDELRPGAVEVNQGGGGGPAQNADWHAANVNELTDLNNRDEISGFPVLKALLCQITRMAS